MLFQIATTVRDVFRTWVFFFIFFLSIVFSNVGFYYNKLPVLLLAVSEYVFLNALYALHNYFSCFLSFIFSQTISRKRLSYTPYNINSALYNFILCIFLLFTFIPFFLVVCAFYFFIFFLSLLVFGSSSFLSRCK